MKKKNVKYYLFEGGPWDGREVKCYKRASGRRVACSNNKLFYHYYRKCKGVMCYQGIFEKTC